MGLIPSRSYISFISDQIILSLSMAYTSSSLYSSSLAWDSHNNHLGLVNNTDRMSLAMDEYMMMTMMMKAPCCSPPLVDQSDFSTGYLEDALLEFSEPSKRRRVLLYTDNEINHSATTTSVLEKSHWNSHWEFSENFDCMTQLTSSSALSVLPGDPVSITTPISRVCEETNRVTKINTAEEAPMPAPEAIDSSSSSSYKEDSANTNSDYLPARPAAVVGGSSSDEKRRKKKGVIRKVVYPFALVKPGGVEGDITLNDINERILMPPTRPVRHPVGDFACRPCVSADGPGLSGKAVVALTRIHTQGRGTITIIRTKG
ncbi:hypothetical protein PRUPE_1G339600 [Prunus persica]|uniref:Protein XRI1 n=1 Tax=Prunus persica TaxID=3760 RepID=A0A251RA09_PRUPE|nr:uncharacterized protein LOC18791036 [Prunus persica]ONI31925.1 hypothetical protein PRUPE_1G339600 [Prunus persica]